MKKSLVFLASAIFSIALAQAVPVDFSGNWVLNQSAVTTWSRGDIQLLIQQTENELIVARLTIRESQTYTASLRYTFDGEENVNTEQNAAGPVTIRSKSKWNNGALTLEGKSTAMGLSGEVTTGWKREYSLSTDGKTLTILESYHTPFGDTSVPLTFRRQ